MSSNKLELMNFYETIPKEYRDKYGAKYKNWKTIRIDVPTNILICGRTGSGKTNLLLNFITLVGAFDQIYLYAKNLEEPLYKMLIGELTKLGKKSGEQLIYYSNNIDDIPEVDSFDKKRNNLVIFDDMISESDSKQKNISDLYIRGRKQNITSVYLSQSYYLTPKKVRDQCSYIMLKTISSVRDLKLILKEYNFDKSAEELMKLYKIATSTGLGGFLMIDTKANTPPELQFRNGFLPFSAEKQET